MLDLSFRVGFGWWECRVACFAFACHSFRRLTIDGVVMGRRIPDTTYKRPHFCTTLANAACMPALLLLFTPNMLHDHTHNRYHCLFFPCQKLCWALPVLLFRDRLLLVHTTATTATTHATTAAAAAGNQDSPRRLVLHVNVCSMVLMKKAMAW